MLIITGGAGFIGSNFVLDWFSGRDETILNLDKLTYAGNIQNLASLEDNQHHTFVQGDIGDRELIRSLLKQHKPRAILNFAAESHVDRSIHGPEDFILTNVNGTFHLLDEVKSYWSELPSDKKTAFRFLHVSTDEVYGSLEKHEPAFSEKTAYAPNSPYSASKAASDHLVRAYFHTYGLPTLTTNCSNNYGPLQFPEKLIPLMILNAVEGKPLPVYGDGQNIRDWLYVGDHCAAIRNVLDMGKTGEVYNIGGNSEKTNLDVVHTICSILDELRPTEHSYSELITYVTDRPGHDRRYAIDAQKIESELEWAPVENFATGISKTINWYLDNNEWTQNVTSGSYKKWVNTNYSQRKNT